MSQVTVVLYTDAHRITGEIALKERLSDALNDPLETHIEISDVRVAKLVDPLLQEVQWPHTVLSLIHI